MWRVSQNNSQLLVTIAALVARDCLLRAVGGGDALLQIRPVGLIWRHVVQVCIIQSLGMSHVIWLAVVLQLLLLTLRPAWQQHHLYMHQGLQAAYLQLHLNDSRFLSEF